MPIRLIQPTAQTRARYASSLRGLGDVMADAANFQPTSRQSTNGVQGNFVAPAAAAAATASTMIQTANRLTAEADAKLNAAASAAASARAATAGKDRQTAGRAIVSHLQLTRDAVQAKGHAMKAQAVAVKFANAAALHDKADKLGVEANTYRRSRNGAAAAPIEAQVSALRGQADMLIKGGKTLASQQLSVPVPRDLTDEHIIAVAGRYDLRARKRTAMENGDNRVAAALTARLGEVNNLGVWKDTFQGVSEAYGGGTVAGVFAAAELGNLGELSAGLGDLGFSFDEVLGTIGGAIGINPDDLKGAFNSASGLVSGLFGGGGNPGQSQQAQQAAAAAQAQAQAAAQLAANNAAIQAQAAASANAAAIQAVQRQNALNVQQQNQQGRPSGMGGVSPAILIGGGVAAVAVLALVLRR